MIATFIVSDKMKYLTIGIMGTVVHHSTSIKQVLELNQSLTSCRWLNSSYSNALLPFQEHSDRITDDIEMYLLIRQGLDGDNGIILMTSKWPADYHADHGIPSLNGNSVEALWHERCRIGPLVGHDNALKLLR